MGKEAWDDIPSIGELSVDWEYEPDNPLGKRLFNRLKDEDLGPLLNVDGVKVQVATSKFNTRGKLADLSQNGVAIFVPRNIGTGTVIKLGMILGKHKLISKGIVRNVSSVKDAFRVGIEFYGINAEDKAYIEGLYSSVSYKY